MPSDDIEKYSCRPFLPKLFVETPPAPDHPAIEDASRRLGEYFSKRFAKGDIDSLSVAVVTSSGALFEENYGVVRGNETASSPPTTSHSQYRIASVSKLFAVLEGLLLEQRGALSW
jgi:CubicO group peptidase (beta-lactamase class C family)